MLGIIAALGGADCERIRSGGLAQPANAVSSLAHVAVGLWLLSLARTVPAGGHRRLLVGAGVAMVAVGFTSFAYHGPQPGWAHVAHDVSIAVLAFVVLAGQVRLVARPDPTRIATLLSTGKKALPFIAAALCAYWAGRTVSPLCRPASAWQYHAVWHVASAIALGVVVTTSRSP